MYIPRIKIEMLNGLLFRFLSQKFHDEELSKEQFAELLISMAYVHVLTFI